MLSKQTLEFGNEIAPAILGVDALYCSESGDEEGMVVIRFDGKKNLQPEHFRDYEEAQKRFKHYLSLSATLPEADRRVYYRQLCQSMLAFITWRADGLTFEEQLRQFIHSPVVGPASDKELDELREKMRLLLNRMNYKGDLKEQCTAWEEANRVPPEEVPAVLEKLMDEAWERTERLLFKIPAPRSDGMKVVTVKGMHFNARCNYNLRSVELNIDPILTRPGLKHLTVHEGYPGHYIQFKMRQVTADAGESPDDNYLSIVNSASSSNFEGVADNGIRMLDWYEGDNDLFSGLMGRYRSGIGTGAAWRMHALNWSAERTADWLRSQSLAGGEGWINNRMGFISAPERAVLIWTYWWGEAMVAPIWERIPADRKPEFLRFMYDRMHSSDSLAMFQ